MSLHAEQQFDTFKAKLSAARAPELPAQAASLVSGAQAAERTAAAADAVRAAVSVNESATPLVVGAIARNTPEAAAAAAGAAASAQPKQVTRITKAAVGAAPAQVEAIVAAVCKAQPGAFAEVGLAAAQVAPKARTEILRGISSASPALKAVIARVSGASKEPLTLVTLLGQSDALLSAWAKSLGTTPGAMLAADVTPQMSTTLAAVAIPAPPVLRPPYVELSGTPGEITVSQTSEAPPGGPRVLYSAP